MSNLKAFSGGVIVPILTPLLPDNNVDVEALRGLARYMIDSGVDGIFAMGTAGESPLLTRKQRAQALSVISEECSGKVPLLVGLLEASTDRVLELIPEAEQMGAQAIVVTTPYYYPVKQREMIKHFAAVREATSLPIVIYNIPSRTQSMISASAVNELARMPGVIGYKDSSGDMSEFQMVLRLTRDLPRFFVLQGSHSLCIASLLIGADGLVPGLGNLIPRQITALVEAVKQRRMEEAYQLFDQMIRLEQLMMVEGYSLSIMKAMIQLLGYGQGVSLRPLPPVNSDGMQRLKTFFESEQLLQ